MLNPYVNAKLNSKARIAILGGGISGLASAYYCKKYFPNADIHLYEMAPWVGGWVETQCENEFVNE